MSLLTIPTELFREKNRLPAVYVSRLSQAMFCINWVFLCVTQRHYRNEEQVAYTSCVWRLNYTLSYGEQVHHEKENSDWFPELSKFATDTAKMGIADEWESVSNAFENVARKKTVCYIEYEQRRWKL